MTGSSNFNPTDNGAEVDFDPEKVGLPADPVNVENAGSVVNFGIISATLQFTAVPEPSAFLYGGVVAAIAGLGYRGRQWFGGSDA